MNAVVTHRQATVGKAADLAALVADAAASSRPVVDYGVAHQGLGHPQEEPGDTPVWAIDGSGIIEHYLPDMTVRIAAGATLGSVQRTLAASEQFIPFDADDDLSIGEIITHNVYGPLRAAFGGPRDLLLGLRYVDGQGREIAVGGRTVKNVAGYDVTRFMVGSLNELGLLTEATLRTYAIPKHVLAVRLRVENPATFRTWGTAWMLSDAAPATALLTRNDAGQWLLEASYFGRPEACEAQAAALSRLVEGQRELSLERSGVRTFAEDDAARKSARAWRRRAAAAVKLIVAPASLGDVLGRLPALGKPLHVEALPLHGCAFVGGDLTPDEALQLQQSWVQPALRGGGVFAWLSRPDGAQQLPPLGPVQGDVPLLQRIKKTMDPCGIFNPGRFLSAKDGST